MSVLRLLHGTRSTPVSRLRLGDGIYVAIDSEGTHVISTTPTDFGGQAPEEESQIAVQQVVTEWTIVDGSPGRRFRIAAVPAAATEVSSEWRTWWPLAGLKQARLVINTIEAAPAGTKLRTAATIASMAYSPRSLTVIAGIRGMGT